MFFSQESPLIESLGLKNTNLVNIEARACSFSKEKQGMCEHLFGHIKILRVFFFFYPAKFVNVTWLNLCIWLFICRIA